MNERIQELVEQASEKINYTVDPNTFSQIDDPNGPHIRTQFNKEKFAKLIIRECIKSIRPYDASGHFEETIREHFYGVEE